MREKKKTLILFDGANIFYGFENLSWDIDYKKFYKWLQNEFIVLEVFFFGGIISKQAYRSLHPNGSLDEYIEAQKKQADFFKLLRIFGYKTKTKPVACLYDKTNGCHKRKCNFDVEITIAALDKIDVYDELVLCSGDGDFVKLLKYVKGKYKKTTVIVDEKMLNWELEKTANRAIFFKDIKPHIERIKNYT